MLTKFSEDVIPLSDLKINPGKIVNQVKATHRPVLITSRGRGVAVVQDLYDYEKNEEERAFMKVITQGLMDVKNGNVMELSEVRTKLGVRQMRLLFTESAFNDLADIQTYYQEQGVTAIGDNFVIEIIAHA